MFNWLYNNVIAPVGNWISDAASWTYDNILTPIYDTGMDILTGGQHSANRVNQQIAAENLAYQREANEQNIAFQREENEITRQREDTAVQRAAADMEAAGLSQTLATGHPASSASLAAPQVQPLHNDYKMEKLNHLAGFLSIAKSIQDIKTSSALSDKYLAEASGQNLSNGVFAEGFATEQAVKKANIELSLADASYKKSLDSLNQIKGKTYGDYLLAELDNMRSNTKLTNEEIAYKIAQKEHLGKEDEKILQDILESVARVKNYEHDLAIAQKTGLPVGTVPNGYFGGAYTTATSIGSKFKSWIRDKLGKMILPDSISTSNFGGGLAW